jgi:hypothetical protein
MPTAATGQFRLRRRDSRHNWPIVMLTLTYLERNFEVPGARTYWTSYAEIDRPTCLTMEPTLRLRAARLLGLPGSGRANLNHRSASACHQD